MTPKGTARPRTPIMSSTHATALPAVLVAERSPDRGKGINREMSCHISQLLLMVCMLVSYVSCCETHVPDPAPVLMTQYMPVAMELKGVASRLLPVLAILRYAPLGYSELTV